MKDVKRSCRTCEFAEMTVIGDDPVIECRRFPPTTSEPFHPAPIIDALDDDCMAFTETSTLIEVELIHPFPRVRETDWCGEYSDAGSS